MKNRFFLMLLSVALIGAGCSYQRQLVKGGQIHGKARIAAVLPLVNLSGHPHAGRIVGDLLVTELYAGTAFQLMEHTLMLTHLNSDQQDWDEVLERQSALALGEKLGVDTVIFGSVTEYRYKRGLDEDPVVGINLRLLDVASRQILWAGSKSASGGCFWFCEDSLNRLTQRVCHDLVSAMAAAR
jgi:TolB-like protein